MSLQPNAAGRRAEQRWIPYALVSIWLACSIGIIIVAYVHQRAYERQYRGRIEREVSAIAKLKAGELAQWRGQRLGDASLFVENPPFARLVQRWLADPRDDDAQNQIRTWLSRVRASYRYDRIVLLDAHSVERMTVAGSDHPNASLLPDNTAEVLQAGKVVMSDFYRPVSDGRVHLAVLVPILPETPGAEPLAVLVLQIDPAVYLYPFISHWPTLSGTAETLLVQRQGDNVLFLNDLRFQPGTAVSLRVPVTDTERLAVKATLGPEGVMEGLDYRGAQVLGAVSGVPGSAWRMIAHMDLAEIYKPVRERLAAVIGVVCVLLLATGMGIGLIWRQVNLRAYRHEAALIDALRRSESRLRSLFNISQYNVRSVRDLLNHALDEAIRLTDSAIGYIYHYDEDRRIFILNSWSKEVMKECSVVQPQTEYHLDSTGLWGEAVRQRQPIIVNDYEAPNPRKKGCPRGHVALRKFLTVPIFDGRRIVAVVGVANKRTDYDETDALQLTLLMDAVWKIMQRKQAEETLRQSQAQLEETNQHLQEAIERANRMALEASQASAAKSQFLANMSHEIRTPMTAILGFAETLGDAVEQCPANPESATCAVYQQSKESVQIIQRNGRHLLGLINDILDLSKVEAGKMELERVPCSPIRIVEEVLSLMRVRAMENHLSLEVVYRFPLPDTILGDPFRLRQVLVNLVGNAIKFTNQGRVEIDVCWEAQEGGQNRMVFHVKDTGIGMTQEQMDSLFQPFAQADSSTTRRYGGTGLGLAISKRLAEAMGGNIEVTSQSGQGSTFTLKLQAEHLSHTRMLNSLTQVAALNPGPVGPTSSTPAQLCGRILLAEDGPDNQKLISSILRKAGAQVDLADTGRLALDKALAAVAAGEPYDAILMDMQMPEMDGYEAAGRLRQEGYKGPVIALTAHAMAGDREECIAAGCDDYASKPVNRDELLSILARQMNCRRAGPPTSPAPAAANESIVSDFQADPDMAEVLVNFVQRLPARLADLREAARNGQWDVLRRLAHQLKGAGGSYGYSCLSNAARDLESQAGCQDAEAAALTLSEMTHLCEKIQRGWTARSVPCRARTI